MKRKIVVYTGQDYSNLCGPQKHPLDEAKTAVSILTDENTNSIQYSNSPDFITTICYGAIEIGIDIEFIHNGVSQGNGIEMIFNDFNRALDITSNIGDYIKIKNGNE
ncbi:MAG: hypothetical protein M0R46_16540 [Candidatus Muirbacterium halophilum]|nr:hypothetical protein [Candidatus Muirbacterium halophilum]